MPGVRTRVGCHRRKQGFRDAETLTSAGESLLYYRRMAFGYTMEIVMMLCGKSHEQRSRYGKIERGHMAAGSLRDKLCEVLFINPSDAFDAKGFVIMYDKPPSSTK